MGVNIKNKLLTKCSNSEIKHYSSVSVQIKNRTKYFYEWQKQENLTKKKESRKLFSVLFTWVNVLFFWGLSKVCREWSTTSKLLLFMSAVHSTWYKCEKTKKKMILKIFFLNPYLNATLYSASNSTHYTITIWWCLVPLFQFF